MTYLSPHRKKETKADAIKRIFLKDPDATFAEVMALTGASRRYVARVRSEIIQGFDNFDSEPAKRKLLEKQIAGSSSGTASVGFKNERIEELIVKNPWLSNADVAQRAKASVSYVVAVALEMRRNGFYRGLEREIKLEEYFNAHPGATREDAAKHFNVPVWQINYTLRGFEWDSGKPGELWENDTLVDEEMWRRRCIRPEWYVKEVCGEGYMGIELPEDEFKLYLEIREKKRRKGLIQARLPLYLMDGYKGKGKSDDDDEFWN